jgi:acyl-CoA thioester hydrolase
MAKIPLSLATQTELFAFATPVRVYFENTDAGGVVYHSEYLKFLERGRSEWLRHLGYTHAEMASRHDIIFIVTEMALAFLRPARLDDLLQVSVAVEHLGRVRVTFAQEIRLEQGRESEVLVRAKVTVAAVAPESFKAREIPTALRQKMQVYA